MRAGLVVPAEPHGGPRRGDFWSQLFVLEAG